MTSARIKSAGIGLALFLGNLWLVRDLLTTEYLGHMGSIEGSRIALSRWILQNWRDLSWFPLWYGGIPFENTYPPLCHVVTAAVAAATGSSPAHAYHMVIAVLYALGPVTLFFLALRMSGSCVCGSASALFYSLVSPSAFLIPIVAQELGSIWRPRRLQSLVLYGEGPHVVSLSFLPLALLLLMVAVQKRRPAWWLLAALGASSVLLTNWLGATEFVLMAGAWLLASPARPRWRLWLQAAGLAVCTYALSSPWVPPRTVWAFMHSEEFRAGGYTAQLGSRLLFLGAALLALLCLLWLFERYRFSTPCRFGILFLFPSFWITASAVGADPRFMPHRLRFHLVMEMGLAFLLGLGLKLLIDRLPSRGKRVVAWTLLALCIYPAARYAAYAQRLIRPVDVRTTIEYQEAKWLERQGFDGRVFVSGSTRFFMNAFTDIPQMGGGFDPGVINPVLSSVSYQILSGENAGPREGEIAALWLKAFGVDAISVSGPNSREAYRDYRNPRKFEGVLPEAWRDADDVIYSVPRRSASLVHVIRPADLVQRAPVHGLDVEPIRGYVAALEDSSLPLATFEWRNHHSATITAPLEKDQVLSVQVSYHHGWRASVDGQPRRVYGDNLGQMVIEPDCQGHCTVELLYDGGTEMLLCRVLSWSCLGLGLFWSGWGILHRRRPAVVH